MTAFSTRYEEELERRGVDWFGLTLASFGSKETQEEGLDRIELGWEGRERERMLFI